MAERRVHDRSGSFISLQMNSGAAMVSRERQKKREDIYQQILHPAQASVDHHSTMLSSLLICQTGNESSKNHLTEDIRELLDYGIDVNLRNEYGETAFAEALKHKAPIEVILAIAERTKDVNEPDDTGKTALHYVLSTEGPVDPQLLAVLLGVGCDFEINESCCSGCPNLLCLLLERETEVGVLLEIAEKYQPDVIGRNKMAMLRYAAKDGSARSLKAVLACSSHAETGYTPCEFALHIAASSSREPKQKVCTLLAHGVNIHVRDQRSATLMHVAASNHSQEILKLCYELGLDPNATDQNGNTPLHYACYSLASFTTSCIDVLIQMGANVNQTNKQHESPLIICINTNAKSDLISLIQSGAVIPSHNKIQHSNIHIDRLSMLCDSKVVFASPNPIAMAMNVSGMLQRLARLDTTHRETYRHLGEEMEEMALTMLMAGTHNNQCFVTDELLSTALNNRQKKIIGHPSMQNYLTKKWFRCCDFRFQTTLFFIWLTSVYCFKIILAPLIISTAALWYGKGFDKVAKKVLFVNTPPAAQYVTNILFYAAFITILTIDSKTTAGIHDPRTFVNTDFIVFAFLAGFVLKEAGELKAQGVAHYFSSWKNWLDVLMIVLFAIKFSINIVNVVLYGGETFPSALKSTSSTQRVASHAYAFACLVAVLRLLGYLQSIHSIGPVLISFKKIIKSTLSFIVILALCLLGFAMAITNVYAANIYTVDFDNFFHCVAETHNITQTQLISIEDKIRHQGDEHKLCLDNEFGTDPPLQPEPAFGVTTSAVNLMWAMFGLIDTNDYDSYNELETFLGLLLLALWLVSSIIVLTNMLVAIITNAFQKVQDNADLEWKFVHAEVIWETITAPSVPPPLNIPYHIAMAWASLTTVCRSKKTCCTGDQNNEECSSNSSEKPLQEAYMAEIKQTKLSAPATKKRLKKLEKRLLQKLQSLHKEEHVDCSLGSIGSESDGCYLERHDTDSNASTVLGGASTGLGGPATGDMLQQFGCSLEKLTEGQKNVLLQLERINRRLLVLEKQNLLQTDLV